MSAEDWAVRVEGVSKKFGLTLGAAMKYGLRDVAGRLLGKAAKGNQLRQGEFWAVHDVSFELYRGEALGIMGVNGCGKTTLLRMLNGTYAPDAGRIVIRGRVGALIAAGAGFAPMLSGRENIYVNGALLGLSTKEIDRLMDEIVAFSELGEFIDLPVRNYSSGMYVRLGFAIAALSKPDVLLMDEVLAVGDMNFQKKCFDQVIQLKRNGTAIILVSHSPGVIWSLCDRGIFMDHGQTIRIGAVEEIINAYEDRNAISALEAGKQFESALLSRESRPSKNGVEEIKAEYGHAKGGTGDAVCTRVCVSAAGAQKDRPIIQFREPFALEADLKVLSPLDDFIVRFTIDATHYRFIVCIDSYEQGVTIKRIAPGQYRIWAEIQQQTLRPGAYTVNVSLQRRSFAAHLFYWSGAVQFVIAKPQTSFLYAEPNAIVHLDAKMSVVECDAGGKGFDGNATAV